MKRRELSYLVASLKELEGDNIYGENFPQMTLEQWSHIDVKDFVKRRKVTARAVVGQAVRIGLIKKQPCVDCGSRKSEAHHPDYTRSLDVVWLCRKHHSELHKSKRYIDKIRRQNLLIQGAFAVQKGTP
jgi:hypothetical protein